MATSLKSVMFWVLTGMRHSRKASHCGVVPNAAKNTQPRRWEPLQLHARTRFLIYVRESRNCGVVQNAAKITQLRRWEPKKTKSICNHFSNIFIKVEILLLSLGMDIATSPFFCCVLLIKPPRHAFTWHLRQHSDSQSLLQCKRTVCLEAITLCGLAVTRSTECVTEKSSQFCCTEARPIEAIEAAWHRTATWFAASGRILLADDLREVVVRLHRSCSARTDATVQQKQMADDMREVIHS